MLKTVNKTQSGKTSSKMTYQYQNQWIDGNDLVIHYSLENFFGYHEYPLKILINVLMSLLARFVASSPRGGGERLGLGGS